MNILKCALIATLIQVPDASCQYLIGSRGAASSPTTPGTRDTIPPFNVYYWNLVSRTSSSIRFEWRTVGDDLMTGTAASYDVRRSFSLITDGNWSSATQVTGEPTPRAAGNYDSLTVSGLLSATTYYFAMKVSDDSGNVSPLSSNFIATTTPIVDSTRPARVTTLAATAGGTSSINLTWVATGDDSLSGLAESYDIRYTTNPALAWSAWTIAPGIPDPLYPGNVQSLTISGLSSGTAYYVAMTVSDEVPNTSAMSDTATATTNSPADVTAPATIATLAVDSSSIGKMYLSWTAPGDDGSSGTATSYSIRYSTRSLGGTNVITNPDIETSSTGWEFYGSGGLVARSLVRAHGGSASLALSASNSTDYPGAFYYYATTTRDSLTFGVWVYATTTCTIDLLVLDQTYATIGGSDLHTISAGSWQYVSRSVRPSGGQTGIRAGVRFSPGITSAVVYLDDATATIGTAFSTWTVASGIPSPSVAGTHQTLAITGLRASTMYYAAMTATDEAGNTSGTSNVVYIDPTRPAPVTTLASYSTGSSSASLRWTTVGDDSLSGQATSYDLRYATSRFASDDVVSNRHFETDSSGWTAYDATLSRTDTAHSGAKALKVTASSNWGAAYYSWPRTGTDTAFVSAWIYLTTQDTVSISLANENLSDIEAYKKYRPTANTWTEMRDTIVLSGSELSVNLVIQLANAPTARRFFLDDVSMTFSGLPWASGTSVTGEPSPKAAGLLDSASISGLSASTTYYAAIKVADGPGITSRMSNVATFTTTSGAVADWTIDGTKAYADDFSGLRTFHVKIGGNDGNSGLTEALAWATIGKANNTLQPGDQVLIHAGTYTDPIAPARAGTSGSPIVYRNYSTDVCSLYISGGYGIEIDKDYVIVQGIAVKMNPTSAYHPVYIHDCEHSAAINCRTYGGSTQNTSTRGDWNTWRLDNIRLCRITGNVVDRLDAAISDDNYRGDGIALTGANSHYNIIEGNYVKNVSHFAIAVPVYTSDGAFNIVRNNVAWNSHGLFGTSDGARHTLWEGNTGWNPGMIDTYQSGPAMEMFGDSTIVRYNKLAHDTTVTTVGAQSVSGWGKFVEAGTELIIEGSTAPYDAEKNGRYYGNAFTAQATYPVGYADDRYKFALTILDAGVSGFGFSFGKNVLKNNIIAYSTDTALVYYQNGATSYTTMADTFDGNDFWNGTPGEKILSASTSSHTGEYTLSQAKSTFPLFQSNNLNVSPLWVDSTTDGANRSYRISGNSLCKDAGVALTVTASSASAGQKIINVGDATYFHYDWGASPYDRGDSLLVGSERIELDSVDYVNNRLIAKSNLSSTIAAGSNVHIIGTYETVRGYVRRLFGSAPDIGPYEVASSTSSSSLYGSGIGADALNNTRIGGEWNWSTSYGFRATHSAALSSIRPYIIWSASRSGYNGGTGGSLKFEVQTDNGGIPSGTVLASYTLTTPMVTDSNFRVIAFSSPPTLSAGVLYHIVITNPDASPTVNYVSVNSLYNFVGTTPRQQIFNDADWFQLIRVGSGSWASADDGGSYTPILELNYADGYSCGNGYMEVWTESTKDISGTSSVREAFTVSGSSRTVSGVKVRVKRVSGSDPLTIRLEESDGTLLTSATASGVSTSDEWVSVTFSSAQVLTVGQAYNLTLQSPSGSLYQAYPIRKGSAYAFTNGSYFPDGYAEFTTGGAWAAWDAWGVPDRTESDLQFVFVVE